MEVIKNNKGGLKLCRNGFQYTIKYEGVTKIRWECSMRRRYQCDGGLTTNKEMTEVQAFHYHSHEPSSAMVEATKNRMIMKDAVSSSRVKPGQILAKTVNEMTMEGQMALGDDETIRRNLRRQKRAHLPANPRRLRDLVIEGVWKTTGGSNPKPFVIYDSGRDDQQRVVVFAADELLQHLAYADTWFIDGTFSSAPKLFTQLVVIRATLSDTAVTCAYAVLKGKSQEQYSRVLRAIAEKTEACGLSVDPNRIVCDFEMALINAIRSVLGDQVTISGCFYHLCQATRRKVQEVGLATEYQQNPELRLFLGMLDGLAFLPVDQVTEGLSQLKPIAPNVNRLMEVITYFEHTYVLGQARMVTRPESANIVFRRLPPLFPPSVWNVHQATMENRDRTNNICEGWHNSFKSLLDIRRPSIWVAIEAIQADQALALRKVHLNSRGLLKASKKKRETVARQKRLAGLCSRRLNGMISIMEFLRGVGHNIRLTRMFVPGDQSSSVDNAVDETNEPDIEDVVLIELDGVGEVVEVESRTVDNEYSGGPESLQVSIQQGNATAEVNRQVEQAAREVNNPTLEGLLQNDGHRPIPMLAGTGSEVVGNITPLRQRVTRPCRRPVVEDIPEEDLEHPCPVCYMEEAKIAVFPCGHCFGERCIERLTDGTQNGESRCALCRNEIVSTVRVLYGR